MVRLDGRVDPPFRAAANTSRLVAAFDRLAGVGRWSPLVGLGTFPIRFPHSEDPGDDGPFDFFDVSWRLANQTASLPESVATGDAGDVWLCHPYLVHAARPHRGRA